MREGGVNDCRNFLESCRQLTGLRANGSAEKVQLELESQLLSGLFKGIPSQMRSRENVDPSVGTVDSVKARVTVSQQMPEFRQIQGQT